MKRSNGTGTVVKLAGSRRKPYAVRVSGRDSRGYVVQRCFSELVILHKCTGLATGKGGGEQIPSAFSICQTVSLSSLKQHVAMSYSLLSIPLLIIAITSSLVARPLGDVPSVIPMSTALCISSMAHWLAGSFCFSAR